MTKLAIKLAILFSFWCFFTSISLSVVSAACGLPENTNGCADESNPDYNPDLRGTVRDPNTDPNVYDLNHDKDPNLPALADITGRDPVFTGVGSVNVLPHDSPDDWENTNTAWMQTQPGEVLHAPGTGYDIGEGYNWLVLYADENTIVINSTRNGNIVDGYTLTLDGIETNAQILAAYNEAVANGRTELPALDSLAEIGRALGNELNLSIRDKGTFMDPRWLEWWDHLSPLTNPQDMKLLLLLLASITQTPTPPPLKCMAAQMPDGPFRPEPCEDCGAAVKLPTSSCAENFNVHQDTHFYFVDKDTSQGYWDEEASEPVKCETGDPYAYFTRDWGGTITLDNDRTKVPFAGYHDKLENQEQKYLAQYFTGSLVSNGPKYAIDTRDYALELEREAGVMNKIFPEDELDNLRCKRIKAANKDEFENYRIPFKENPNLPSPKKLKEFVYDKQVPCFRPKVAIEVDPAAWKEWDDKLVNWLKTDDAKLWPFIPLTTLKDAPGTLSVNVQRNPGVVSPGTVQLSFPHLASLYEASEYTWKLLSPRFGPGTAFPTVGQSDESEVRLKAQLEESHSYCGLKAELTSLIQPKTALAADPPDTWYYFLINPGLVPLGDGQYQSNWVVSVRRNDDYVTPDGQHQADAFDASHVQLRITIQGTTTATIDTVDLNGATNVAGGNNTFAYNYGNMTPLTITATPGSQITFTVTVVTAGGYNMAQEDPYKLDGVTMTVSCTVNADGTIDETTCVSTAPPIPTPDSSCKNPDKIKPAACFDTAISDINPNDVVCSNPYPLDITLGVPGYKVALTEDQFKAVREEVSRCIDKCHECTENVDCYPGCDEDCYWQQLGDYVKNSNGDIDYRKLPNRDVGIVLTIPYLEKIGHFTIGELENPNGIFDIFRPAFLKRFKNEQAKSEIGYTYVGKNSYSPKKGERPPDDDGEWLSENSGSDRSSGEFYYPWLGGVEKAKQCVSTSILRPQVGWADVVSDPNCPGFTDQNN